MQEAPRLFRMDDGQATTMGCCGLTVQLLYSFWAGYLAPFIIEGNVAIVTAFAWRPAEPHKSR